MFVGLIWIKLCFFTFASDKYLIWINFFLVSIHITLHVKILSLIWILIKILKKRTKIELIVSVTFALALDNR